MGRLLIIGEPGSRADVIRALNELGASVVAQERAGRVIDLVERPSFFPALDRDLDLTDLDRDGHFIGCTLAPDHEKVCSVGGGWDLPCQETGKPIGECEHCSRAVNAVLDDLDDEDDDDLIDDEDLDDYDFEDDDEDEDDFFEDDEDS